MIEKYRKDIDKIDKELSKLFQQRMDIVEKISQYKKENHLDITDSNREEYIIEHNKKYVKDDLYIYFKEFFNNLFSISKKYQSRKEFVLIGKNISYSYSPFIHHMIFESNQLNYHYSLFDTEDDNIINRLREKGVKGANVTIPYKESIIKEVDVLSDEAKKIGAVNTLLIKDKVYGYNTDYYGFLKTLERYDVSFNQDFTILGSGGAARSILSVLLDHDVKNIYLVSRNKELAEEKFKNFDVSIIDYSEVENLKGVLINATPIGRNGELPLKRELLMPFDTLIDLIYNPLYTPMLEYGIYHDKKVINGLYMLISQAVKTEEIINNIMIENVDDIYKKVRIDLLQKYKKGVLLIGMPGSGKSSFGKELGDFIDTDIYLEEKYDESIEDMFKKSEAYFRKRETEVYRELSILKHKVIASGGGIIKKKENMDYFKHHLIVFIDREVDDIIKDVDINKRPLLSKKEDVLKLYHERIDLYKQYADIIVKNDRDFNDVLKELKELI